MIAHYNTHQPVMLDEAVDGLVHNNRQGIYCDATFGRGGHSLQILKALDPQGKLYGIDQDPDAESFAQQTFQAEANKTPATFQFIRSNFANLETALPSPTLLDGMILDLGVSSPQLDNASRGFSFMKNGPLDMRMNPQQGLPAREWLKQQSQQALRNYLHQYGDITNAKRWSILIKQAAMQDELQTTQQLSELIIKNTPTKRLHNAHKHPATQIFQAIRIALNNELGELEKVFQAALRLLKKGGRMVIISFHSLEHRLVRQYSRMTYPQSPPKNLMVKAVPLWQVIRLLSYPSTSEINQNPRCRSARLSILERGSFECNLSQPSVICN